MSQPPLPITLRPEQDGDEAFLLKVYASVREEELNHMSWAPETRSAFLEIQFRAMRHGYRSMYPQAEFSIVLLNQEPVGRMVVARSQQEIRIVDIALLPASRGKGLGTQLIRQVLDQARAMRKPVVLTVRSNNRAANLYQRLGFQFVGHSGVDHAMRWQT